MIISLKIREKCLIDIHKFGKWMFSKRCACNDYVYCLRYVTTILCTADTRSRGPFSKSRSASTLSCVASLCTSSKFGSCLALFSLHYFVAIDRLLHNIKLTIDFADNIEGSYTYRRLSRYSIIQIWESAKGRCRCPWSLVTSKYNQLLILCIAFAKPCTIAKLALKKNYIPAARLCACLALGCYLFGNDRLCSKNSWCITQLYTAHSYTTHSHSMDAIHIGTTSYSWSLVIFEYRGRVSVALYRIACLNE